MKSLILHQRITLQSTSRPTVRGRPKGTSIVNQHYQQENLTATKNKIASIYRQEKERFKKNGEKLPKSC